MNLLVLVAVLTLDGGTPDASVPAHAATTKLSEEDRELVENLDLLQNLEGAPDLELLQDLSLER